MRQDEMKAAKVKAGNYCAYQERTQQEVRDKLYALGLHSDEVEVVPYMKDQCHFEMFCGQYQK